MRLLGRTMKICCVTFNTYLCALALLALCGCKTDQRTEKNPKKQLTAIRFHCETSPGSGNTVLEVPVWRARPVTVTVERDSFVTEANVLAATVVESGGGFSIQVKLDRQGSWLLEKYTATNRGRKIAVFSNFGEERWLAAPVIVKAISNGQLTFTPDATREETERIVRGLNNMRRKIDSKNWFPAE